MFLTNARLEMVRTGSTGSEDGSDWRRFERGTKLKDLIKFRWAFVFGVYLFTHVRICTREK